jgi:3-oxoacyl-[acyl-carrier-protein] synthase-3
MAIIRFNNVGISSIGACVPRRISSNYDLGYLLPTDVIVKMIETTGIKEKRFVDKDTCASDLCFKAAEKLITDNNIDKSEIDILLFLSQTPDYLVPATSPILQERLGLSKETACMDLTLACSGFIYALSTAYAYASLPSVRKVLLLVGDTFSKISNPKDRVNFPLYGDAGTACIVEKGDFGESIFELTSDGSGADNVIVPAMGYRHRITPDDLKDKEREDGNFRSEMDITMDGMKTFDHAIVVIPKQVKTLMKDANITPDDIDFVISHQANKMMIDFIMRRLKIDIRKVPFCLEKYGNTSSPSVPLTIVSELEGKLDGRKKLLLSAIGAGWTYATAYIKTNNINISHILEY